MFTNADKSQVEVLTGEPGQAYPLASINESII